MRYLASTRVTMMTIPALAIPRIRVTAPIATFSSCLWRLRQRGVGVSMAACIASPLPDWMVLTRRGLLLEQNDNGERRRGSPRVLLEVQSSTRRDSPAMATLADAA